MRLFGKVDGAINRFERAAWMTVPFDLVIVSVAPVFAAAEVGEARCATAAAGRLQRIGSREGQVRLMGSVAGVLRGR